MGLSFAVTTPANAQLTPMRVNFGGVDLGGTLSNVTVAPKVMKADIHFDQLGKTVIDRAVSGIGIQVTTELAEVQNKDIWKAVFPSQYEVVTSTKLINFINAVGTRDTSNSKILILHPLANVDADLTQDFKFYKAIASEESEIIHGPEKQSVLKVVWNILPDFTTQPAQFFIYGDPAVGLVAATHGSPGFTGTGNGTMSPIAVYNGFTKTETITAVNVTPQTNAGIFYVSGSVSGPLGLATVGIGFVSPVISFTINDGSTDFVLNDTFTVTTVAANYV